MVGREDEPLPVAQPLEAVREPFNLVPSRDRFSLITPDLLVKAGILPEASAERHREQVHPAGHVGRVAKHLRNALGGGNPQFLVCRNPASAAQHLTQRGRDFAQTLRLAPYAPGLAGARSSSGAERLHDTVERQTSLSILFLRRQALVRLDECAAIPGTESVVVSVGPPRLTVPDEV